MYTVYMHISPNNKKYIGVTKQKPKIRWANGKGYRKQKHFYNAILKYGWDNIKHLIICNNLTKEKAYKLEKDMIKMYKSNDRRYGYNVSPGGEYGRNVKGLHYNIKQNNPARKKVLCIETNIIFETITDANKSYGIDISAIVKCCKGKRQTAGKYHWKYID